MATREVSRCHVSTSTTGTGTYTYTDVSPGAGYRNVAEAVADGSLADGDTVFYYVVDTTALGSANLFEKGSGVINTTAKTLTRVVSESSNAGGTVNWGAGTRDLVFAQVPMSALALLSGATFTGLVESSSGFRSRYDSQRWLDSVMQSTQGTLAIQSAVTSKLPLMIGSLFGSAGTPSGETYIQFLVGSASAVTFGPKIRETGQLQTAAGVPYEAFPSGTKLMFGTAPPTGWTRVNETDNLAPLLAKASDSAGTAGGSWTISGLTVSGSTDATALTVANLPAHDHNVGPLAFPGAGSLPNSIAYTNTGGSPIAYTSGSTGSGTGHSHALSGTTVSSSGAWRFPYKIWIGATKD